MSVSPGHKPTSAESRAHMLDMLSEMELPPVGGSASASIRGNLSAPPAGLVESFAAAGRTATVEDMFNLAAPEVDVVIAKLIPMLVAPTAAGSSAGSAPAAAILPSNPIDICEKKEDEAGGAEAAKNNENAGTKKKDECQEAADRGLVLAVKIGRSKELPIAHRVDHPRMSAFHCEVYYHPLSLQLYIRDISTNGTFMNGSLNRMDKGKLVEVTGGEMIQFVNPNAPAAGTSSTPLPSATYLLQRIKAAKAMDDASLEEELTCGVTKMLLYKPVMALPCLHTFSAHALAQWIDAGNKTCPECRAPMAEVRPSHKVSNLLDQFLKTKATTLTYFTAEEMASFDKANTIPPTGKVIAGGLKRRPNWDEDAYFEEDEEDEGDSDGDSDGGGVHAGSRRQRGGMAWVPPGLPFTFGHFHHASAAGFGITMPVPTCPECATPAPFDGYQCPSMVSHINCHMCKTPFPERPLCGVPQRCALCALPHCDLYFKAMSQSPGGSTATGPTTGTHANTAITASTASASSSSFTPVAGSSALGGHPTGCKNANGRDYFKPIKEHKMTQLPASLFGGNIVEQSILSMYLSTGGCPTTHFQPAPPVATHGGSTIDFNLGINNNSSSSSAVPVPHVWQECLNKFQNGLWVPDLTSVTGPLTVNTAVCEPCCGRIFGSLLYHYRRAIDKNDLPPAILNRPNCWYGIHCRTQFHNTTHAQNFNHVCPQEKRKE